MGMIVNPYRLGSTEGDPHFSSVVLLAGWESGFTDESSYARTLASGGTTRDNTLSKYGTYSVASTGSTNKVTAGDAAAFTLGAGAFTMECWVRRSSVSGNSYIFAQNSAVVTTNSAWALAWMSGGTLEAKAFNGGATYTQFASSSTLPTGAWHHVAYERNASGKFRIYANGAMIASSTPGTAALDDSSMDITILNDFIGSIPLIGNIDEVRMTVGVARYDSDSDYIVPTAAFPRSLGSFTFTTSPTVANNSGFTPGAVGDTLTGTPGTHTAPRESYQWKRDGSAIGGETGLTYTLVSGDSGTTITFEVTAYSGASSVTASASIGPIAASPSYQTDTRIAGADTRIAGADTRIVNTRIA